jgi:predicted dehydrogenase
VLEVLETIGGNEEEVRHGSYGSPEKVADHVKSAKKIIGVEMSRMSVDKRPDETHFREDRAFIFIDAALKGSDPLVSGEDGLRVLEVLEAVKTSLEKGESVKVKYREKF